MIIPFVSRARFEDAMQQIADLKEANAKLLELALSRPTAATQAEAEETPAPSRPHRKLGTQLRAEFRAAAEARAEAAKIHQGAK